MNCTGQLEVNFTSMEDDYNITSASCNDTLKGQRKRTNEPDHIMVILILLAMLTAFINGFVFFLFFKRKKLRTPGNYILLSLAVSDFITGTIDIPIFITYSVKMDHELIRAVEVLCKLTAILTSYHIVAVTAEKYVAIMKPFQHRSASPKLSFTAIGIIWLFSAIIAVLPSVWNTLLRGKPGTHRTSVYLHLGHDVFCFVAVFLLPYIFIVHAQVVMFRAIASRIKKFDRRLTRSNHEENKACCISQERKCVAIFATMAIMFLVCWLPWFILSFCVTMTGLNPELLPVMVRLLPLLKAFAIVRFSTCIINPFLYTFFKRDFMEAVKSVCPQCRFAKEPGLCSSILNLQRNAGPLTTFA